MKERLDQTTIALRIAKEFKDGDVVNLGYGLPTLAGMFIPEDIRVVFHSENGILGFGSPLSADERDEWDMCLINASAQFVTKLPGMSVFNCADAFGPGEAGTTCSLVDHVPGDGPIYRLAGVINDASARVAIYR